MEHVDNIITSTYRKLPNGCLWFYNVIALGNLWMVLKHNYKYTN